MATAGAWPGRASPPPTAPLPAPSRSSPDDGVSLMRYLPHAVATGGRHGVHLAICYKNFAANRGISHIGLGVTALTNARVLQMAGYWCEVWAILSGADLAAKIQQSRAQALAGGQVPLSHVVISAPWIPTAELAALARQFHDIDFTVVSHSNIGFLQ